MGFWISLIGFLVCVFMFDFGVRFIWSGKGRDLLGFVCFYIWFCDICFVCCSNLS